ncbi:MAG: hypothetical protein JWP97_5903 [Labilithrix sp.]|nr:hypothetical protein [Labilithrix sp.]
MKAGAVRWSGPARRWGGSASRPDLEVVASALVDAGDPRELRLLTSALGGAPGFALEVAVIEHLVSLEGAAYEAVTRLLGAQRHPRVRARALASLASGGAEAVSAFAALGASAEPEDLRVVEAAVATLVAPDDLHGATLGLVDLLEAQRSAHWAPVARWIYERGPCSRCRHEAVRWLRALGALPPELHDELGEDADSAIRALGAAGTA